MTVAHGAPRLGQSVSNLAQRLPATAYFNCYHFFGIMIHYNTSFGIFSLGSFQADNEIITHLKNSSTLVLVIQSCSV